MLTDDITKIKLKSSDNSIKNPFIKGRDYLC